MCCSGITMLTPYYINVKRRVCSRPLHAAPPVSGPSASLLARRFRPALATAHDRLQLGLPGWLPTRPPCFHVCSICHKAGDLSTNPTALTTESKLLTVAMKALNTLTLARSPASNLTPSRSLPPSPPHRFSRIDRVWTFPSSGRRAMGRLPPRHLLPSIPLRVFIFAVSAQMLLAQ